MLIKKLTECNGLPGHENDIRNVIKEEIADYIDHMHVDRLGNLIAVKNEHMTNFHIALSAHMDEVGLCVRGITAAGLIKFASWGVDSRVLVAKSVKIGKNKINGVIGAKPIHLQKPAERTKALTFDELYIDIGAKDKADAEKYVTPGDFVAFDSEYVEFGDHKIKAKALDDRIGCAVLIEILKMDLPCKMTVVFNTQEEVGTRGSKVSANHIHADFVINVEGTICNDPSEVDHEAVTTLGKGPAISLMDRSTIYNKKYVNKLVAVAEANAIPCQFRRTGMGGTDAGNFTTAHGGTSCLGISIPTRYIHSPVSVIDKRDYLNAIKLVSKYIETVIQEGSNE